VAFLHICATRGRIKRPCPQLFDGPAGRFKVNEPRWFYEVFQVSAVALSVGLPRSEHVLATIFGA
jgi:hypothetical protein